MPLCIGRDWRVSLSTRLIASALVPIFGRGDDASGRGVLMFDNYIIEIRPTSGITVQAAIVVRDGHGFRFFAATRAFEALEGHVFKSPKAAEQAALRRISDVTSPKNFCGGVCGPA
jgi:hypothetical protein